MLKGCSAPASPFITGKQQAAGGNSVLLLALQDPSSSKALLGVQGVFLPSIKPKVIVFILTLLNLYCCLLIFK